MSFSLVGITRIVNTLIALSNISHWLSKIVHLFGAFCFYDTSYRDIWKYKRLNEYYADAKV